MGCVAGTWKAAPFMDDMEGELAIQVRGAVKGYGSHIVLKGLDMDVPYGSM